MANTLGTMRKAITLDTASDIHKIMVMFKRLCDTNPEAVKAIFGDYLKSKPADQQDSMVQFYKDNAEYLASVFDTR